MKALILAAGDNTRFRRENDAYNKLLHPVLGMPLIERTIISARRAGIHDFVIVTGYQDTRIIKALGGGERLGVQIEYVYNKSWSGENGTSVYTAGEKINENFILLMGDHLFDPLSLERLKRQKLHGDHCILAVDKKIEEFPDADEATKVLIKDGKIIKIGKELTTFNALDTGMFLCSPLLFEVLKKTISRKKFYLTDAMRIFAREGKLLAFDIKDNYWGDIDTHADLGIAEDGLFNKLVQPSKEGSVSKYINRKFSHAITRFLLTTPLTPNQVSILSFLVIIAASFLLTQKEWVLVAFGGLLTQVSSILDGVDGEIARVKLSSSQFGAWFDTVLDRYGDTAVVLGAAIGSYEKEPSFFVVFISVLALSGSILSSYSVHTLQTSFGKYSKKDTNIFALPSGRDIRLFIIFLGAIFNMLFPALILIAFLTHYSVIRRLFYQKIS